MAAAPSNARAGRVEAQVAPEAEATQALYERYGNQIFGYCLHQLGSREEAEDAVQSTFLNAFRGLRRGIVPQAESAWLFKIAQNVCLTRRRSSWRRGRVESPADFQLVEEQAPAPVRRADELIGLQDVLEQMPANQRRAILLREWQGLSYREIAADLDLSPAAVETLIFRARRSLARGLESAPPEQRSLAARIRSSLDLGSVAGALKSLLAAGGAAKLACTAAVVATTAVAIGPLTDEPKPKQLAPTLGSVPAHVRRHVARTLAAQPLVPFEPAATAVEPVRRRGVRKAGRAPVTLRSNAAKPGRLRSAGVLAGAQPAPTASPPPAAPASVLPTPPPSQQVRSDGGPPDGVTGRSGEHTAGSTAARSVWKGSSVSTGHDRGHERSGSSVRSAENAQGSRGAGSESALPGPPEDAAGQEGHGRTLPPRAYTGPPPAQEQPTPATPSGSQTTTTTASQDPASQPPQPSSDAGSGGKGGRNDGPSTTSSSGA